MARTDSWVWLQVSYSGEGGERRCIYKSKEKEEYNRLTVGSSVWGFIVGLFEGELVIGDGLGASDGAGLGAFDGPWLGLTVGLG